MHARLLAGLQWAALVALLALLGMPAAAQTQAGVVQDSLTGERLPGATVQTLPDGRGVAADRFGRFALDVSSRDSVLVRLVGYVPARLGVPREPGVWTVRLAQATAALGDVTVTTADGRSGTTAERLSPEAIRRVPALLGESDPMKVVQLLPGVAQGAEGSVGLHVRGGSPDQTLVLLDGMPVYNASHLFGGLSIFHPDAVQSVRIVRAGVPVRDGGRLGGVLDVVAREGRRDRQAARIGVGLLAARATLEGPAAGDGSYLVAVRRTYASELARPLTTVREGGYRASVGYGFWDGVAKVSRRLGPRASLHASGYAGRDAFQATAEENFPLRDGGVRREQDLDALGWGNLTGTLRAAVALRPTVQASALVGVSRYRFGVERRRSAEPPSPAPRRLDGFRQGSGLAETVARADVDWLAGRGHTVQAGASVHRRVFRPVDLTREREDGGERTVDRAQARVPTRGASAYVEDELRLGRSAIVAAGVRVDAHAAPGRLWLLPQPRVRGALEAGRGWTLTASAEASAQPLHQLTNAGIGLPTDLWVPATRAFPVERGQQASVGVARPVGGWQVSADVFARRMIGVVEYASAAASLPTTDDWEAELVAGRGRAVGLEVLVRRDVGRVQGWIAYTLSRSTRTFPEIERGRTFPYRYDRTHNIAATISRDLSARRRLGATWVASTGQAVTVPVGVTLTNAYVYGPRNDERFPAYHRLDVSYDIRYRRSTLSLGAYNLYNRLNPFAQAVEARRASVVEADGTERVRLRTITLFPVLPHVAVALDL